MVLFDSRRQAVSYDIGLVGLAVMGQNLVLNMSDHGFRVAVYNRSFGRVEEFLDGPGRGRSIAGTSSLEELVNLLERPRVIMLMIKSGQPVDDLIAQLIPLLDPGDIVIDGGNSFFKDTIRRTRQLAEIGLHFVGAGVSGGEIGARRGPSIMPGGDAAAWERVRPIFEAIAAKLPDGSACTEWMGADGAGHYVKMVHNGIEYGYMQMIAEVYDFMRRVLGMSAEAMAGVFAGWNEGKLFSYLVEITAAILQYKDSDGSPLIDKIQDTAEQKGTGRWTAQLALDAGVPLTAVTEAVFARALSALKAERTAAGQVFTRALVGESDRGLWIEDLENALYLAEIISYAQGYMLFRSAAAEYNWDLQYSGIARIWRNGCIIRSALLGHISAAYQRDPELSNLLLDPYFEAEVKSSQESLRRVVGRAVAAGIPTPTLSAALAFFDGYRTERLPANLTQAQRDYFGSHTYERIDQPDGVYFHTNWTGEGGDVTASTYQA
jgi:6-phosphogluconate dehydrogenase